MPADVPARPAPPLSPARIDEGRIYVSGQIGREPGTGRVPEDFEGQAEFALVNLRAIIEEAGGTLASVLKTTLFITRREDFTAMNRIYAEHFAPPYPARTTIVCDLVLPHLLFEIEAVARVVADR